MSDVYDPFGQPCYFEYNTVWTYLIETFKLKLSVKSLFPVLKFQITNIVFLSQLRAISVFEILNWI